MANYTLLNFSFFCIISIFLSSILHQVNAESDDDLAHDLSAKHNHKHIHKPMKQKITKFKVYWQDVLSGSHPTSVNIVKSPTGTLFGNVNMMDNALTVGPNLTSKVVGRAQGFYAGEAQQDISALMVMNFVFTDGKYNGSTISILGRNHITSEVREMPVVGGIGLFRFARGFVEARTKMIDMKTGDATVEYSVYVMHY
ncbi:Dirigent protein 20 [Castilleja foliolosa]|uniref:Dirigent protein n=1 Tax=Castilleja foliolosa TaxID=1961234 RepID=A0ABD3BG25_9LAMI